MALDELPFPPETVDEQIDQLTQALPASLPGEAHTPERRVIAALQDMYTPEQQADAESLASVRKRLLKRGAAFLSVNQRAIPAVERRSRNDWRHRMNRFFSASEGHSRQRAGTIAATMLLAVLLGSLVAGLVLVRRPTTTSHGFAATATPTATTSAAPTPTSPIESVNLLFDTFQMIDATTGWALSLPFDGNFSASKVLRTTDGGLHWNDVTPGFPAAQAHLSGSSSRPLSSGGNTVLTHFLTDSTAWVLSLPQTLFGTTDGGQTWQKAHAPAVVLEYSFINAMDGWVLGKDGGIYRTLNGGQTWTKLQTMSFSGQNKSGLLPYNDVLTGLVFLNAQDGWVTGLEIQTIVPWVYVTHDGGKTWRRQSLALPRGTIDLPLLVSPPTFVNAQDGFLWANINVIPQFSQERAGTPQSGGGGLELYLTHDGGANWQDRSMLPGGSATISFSDASHGWAAASGGSQADTLWVTSNGGQRWNQIRINQRFSTLQQLDFVSETTGWAINWVNTDQPQQLYRTNDGGHTWTEIRYSIVPKAH